MDNIQIIKKAGKSIKDTQLIQGLIVDKEVVSSGMPKRVQDAKIVVTDAALEIEKTEISAEVKVKSATQLQGFIDQEESMLKSMVDQIVAAGANVVFCQKGIDDTVQDYLAKNGIMAIRRVKRSDIEKLTRATGAKITNRLEDLDPETLGAAGLIEEKRIGKDNMIIISECQDPKAVSILVRGAGTNIVEEADRCMHDALWAVKALVETPETIPGGGATQVEISKRLRDYAGTIGGKEQLAIEVYADALESIPKTLAENGGLDSVEILADLRAKHENEDGLAYGLNLFSGQIENMEDATIIEPKAIFLQALRSATEVANMLIKIDDVIVASKLSKGPKNPQEEFEE
jgi:chaperonin GroEL (HSP60 family)